MNALYEIELAIHVFFLQIYFFRPNKKAKPALCDDVTLHNNNFLSTKKAKPALCDDVTLHNSNFPFHKQRTPEPALPEQAFLLFILLILENSSVLVILNEVVWLPLIPNDNFFAKQKGTDCLVTDSHALQFLM